MNVRALIGSQCMILCAVCQPWPESHQLTHWESTQGLGIVRLKDKLGSQQLPTAELALDGLRALKVCNVIVARMQ